MTRSTHLVHHQPHSDPSSVVEKYTMVDGGDVLEMSRSIPHMETSSPVGEKYTMVGDTQTTQHAGNLV